MSKYKAPFDLYSSSLEIRDPGNAGTVSVDRNPAVCNFVSAGAETRTLARPTRSGIIVTLNMAVDGGDIALTVTGGFNEDGDTTFTFADPGQWAQFISIRTSATVYEWRKVSDYSTANITPTEAAALDGITATAAQLNAAALAASSSRTITAIDTIVASDHNKTIFIDNATGFAITLPTPIAGFKVDIIIVTAPTSGNHTIVSSGSANIIKGLQNSVAGDAGDSGTADDTISFVANQALPADKVQLRSDGTSWFAYAISKVAAGITFTQAS